MSRLNRAGWKPLTIRNLINDDCKLIVVIDPKGRTTSGRLHGMEAGRITLKNGYTETSVPTNVEGWSYFKLPVEDPDFGVGTQPSLLG